MRQKQNREQIRQFLLQSRTQQLNDSVTTEDVGFLSSEAIENATVDLTKGFKR